MTVLQSVAIITALFFGPLLITFLTKKIKPLSYLGPVFCCYALGLGLSFAFKPLGWDTSLAMTIAEVMVPVAIPLILFSADLRAVKNLAKPMLISFAAVCLSVILVSCAAFFLLGDKIEDPAGVSGMLIGLYTGGTPNLIAIGKSLKVSDSTIALANTCDVVVGGIYFLLLIAAGPFVARHSAANACKTAAEDSSAQPAGQENVEKKSVLGIIGVVALAVLCLAVGAGLSILITGELTNIVVIMLVVTTLGIAFSFIKKVRNVGGSFEAGQYLIYVFSVGIGLSFDLSSINTAALWLLAYIAIVQFVTVLVHFALSALLKISAPTVIITSVAGVFGPAFIVPVANSMKNKEIIFPGLVCGILGYAVGNYLGIGVGLLLGLF